MSMRIVETQIFQPVLEALAKSNTKPFLVGPNGASLAFTISLLVHNISRTNYSKLQLLPRTNLPQSWVILTPNHDEAEQIYQDLLFFYALLGLPTETVAFFPNRGTAPYEATTPSVDLVAQRMRTLFRLHDQQPTGACNSVRVPYRKNWRSLTPDCYRSAWKYEVWQI